MAVTTAVALYADQQQAKASEKAAEQSQQSANDSFLNIAATENLKLRQEAAKDTQSVFDVHQRSLQAQASARVAAGEAGVGGNSDRARDRSCRAHS